MLLNINDAAKKLNVSRSHVKMLVEDNAVDYSLDNDTIYFDEIQFEDLKDLFIIGRREFYGMFDHVRNSKLD